MSGHIVPLQIAGCPKGLYSEPVDLMKLAGTCYQD